MSVGDQFKLFFCHFASLDDGGSIRSSTRTPSEAAIEPFDQPARHLLIERFRIGALESWQGELPIVEWAQL